MKSPALFWGAMFCALFFSGDLSARETEAAAPAAGFIDVHMHLSGQRDFEPAAEVLISQMDALGIEKSVIMPPPQIKGQKGGSTYKQFLPAVWRHRDRLAFAAGGDLLNPMMMGIAASAVKPPMKREFRKRALQIIEDGASAFGEMTALHFSFSPKHPFEQAEADHPLFLLLADIAAEHGLPIDLHMEAVPEDQTLPPALAQRSPNNPTIVKATLPGFERLLSYNRGAKIVWEHVGWDNTGHMTVALMRRLLQEHSNLYCALKFVRKSYEPFQLGEGILDEDMKVRPEWAALMSEFPDRFMIGADDFITAGARHAGPPSFADTWAVLDQLPEGLKQKIGRDNAAKVYSLHSY